MGRLCTQFTSTEMVHALGKLHDVVDFGSLVISECQICRA